MEHRPVDAPGTEIDDTLPPALERRMVLRLLGYWRSLLDGRAFPAFADLDPAAIADLWPHCFVLELTGTAGDPVFRFIGPDLARHATRPLVGRPVSYATADSLPGLATAYVTEAVARRVPVSRGGTLRGADGAELLYRSILLPVSDGGEVINGFLGAANCREAPETEPAVTRGPEHRR